MIKITFGADVPLKGTKIINTKIFFGTSGWVEHGSDISNKTVVEWC